MSEEQQKKKKKAAPAPKRLGPYDIVRMVGRGGMGAVYEAVKEKSTRRYALKVLLPALASDSSSLARFRREVEAGQKLNHAGIARIHGVGSDKGTYFFAMDFIQGRSLDRIIDGEGIGPSEAARLVRDAAQALHHAHENGIIHRDVKPNNLILSDDGRLVITDFGIAREESAATLTAEGQIMGTPFYMSPEQALGKRKEIGPASDVYSLGVTFYELLTRTTPFRGENIHDILRKIVSEDPIPPSLVAGNVPRELEMVVMKALRKEPAKRYVSARELAEDLDRFLAGQGVRARPMTTTERVTRSLKRNKGLFATGTVAAALVVAFVAFLFVSARGARRAQEQSARNRAEKIAGLLTDATAARTEGRLDDARSALEGVLALDRRHVRALALLKAVEDGRKLEDRRRAEARAREEAAALARRGEEGRGAFGTVHVKHKAAVERVLEMWDRFGRSFEDSRVNALDAVRKDLEGKADRAAEEALDLFGKALLTDPGCEEAHRGIAALRMDQAALAFSIALRTGDFGDVERLLLLVEQHDILGQQTSRIEAIRGAVSWEGDVVLEGRPAPDRIVLYRVDLENAIRIPVEIPPSGRARLRPGSYVAEMTKKGYAGACVPFVVERPRAGSADEGPQRITTALVLDEEKYSGMLYVPGGPFFCGGGGGVRGGPRRTVELPGFFMDRTEVTCARFKVFLDRLVVENPTLADRYRPRYQVHMNDETRPNWESAWKSARPDPFREEAAEVAWFHNEDGTWSPPQGWEDKPVGGVCFAAAAAYARSLGKRLPSSEEWEKGARGVDGRRYPWGDRFIETRAASDRHPDYNARPGWLFIHPADSMPEGASPYGLLHMAGNFSEWTSTDFRGDNKINRGGAAFDKVQMFRCSSLDYTRNDDYNAALGFRCARDID